MAAAVLAQKSLARRMGCAECQRPDVQVHSGKSARNGDRRDRFLSAFFFFWIKLCVSSGDFGRHVGFRSHRRCDRHDLSRRSGRLFQIRFFLGFDVADYRLCHPATARRQRVVPILFSEVNNLHPVAIITAVLVFGSIWGFWGVFFAIPIATLIQAVLLALMKHRLDEPKPKT